MPSRSPDGWLSQRCCSRRRITKRRSRRSSRQGSSLPPTDDGASTSLRRTIGFGLPVGKPRTNSSNRWPPQQMRWRATVSGLGSHRTLSGNRCGGEGRRHSGRSGTRRPSSAQRSRGASLAPASGVDGTGGATNGNRESTWGRRCSPSWIGRLDDYRGGIGATDLRPHAAEMAVDLGDIGMKLALESRSPSKVFALSERLRSAAATRTVGLPRLMQRSQTSMKVTRLRPPSPSLFRRRSGRFAPPNGP